MKRGFWDRPVSSWKEQSNIQYPTRNSQHSSDSLGYSVLAVGRLGSAVVQPGFCSAPRRGAIGCARSAAEAHSSPKRLRRASRPPSRRMFKSEGAGCSRAAVRRASPQHTEAGTAALPGGCASPLLEGGRPRPPKMKACLPRRRGGRPISLVIPAEVRHSFPLEKVFHVRRKLNRKTGRGKPWRVFRYP